MTLMCFFGLETGW